MYLGVILIAALTILITAHVIARYFFQSPITGQVEVASILLITSMFLFIPYTQIKKGHPAVGLIADHYPKKIAAITEYLFSIICLGITLIACWRTALYAHYLMQIGKTFPILKIPQFPVTYFLSFGWGVLSLVILIQLILFFKGVKR